MWIAALSSAFSVTAITYLLSVRGLSLPLLLYAGPFVVWFIFYMLGVWYSQHDRRYSPKAIWLTIIAGFLLECAETYWLQTHFTGGVGIKLSAFIYSVGIVLWVLHPRMEAHYRANAFTTFIAWVGKRSFGIYLIHCYVISIVAHFLPIDSWWLRWGTTILLTILTITIIRKLLPSGLHKYVGIS